MKQMELLTTFVRIDWQHLQIDRNPKIECPSYFEVIHWCLSKHAAESVGHCHQKVIWLLRFPSCWRDLLSTRWSSPHNNYNVWVYPDVIFWTNGLDKKLVLNSLCVFTSTDSFLWGILTDTVYYTKTADDELKE